MNSRPRILIEKDRLMRVCDVIAILGVVASWAIVLVYYNSLPTTIGIHFNTSGNADGFGNKSSIFLLPIISTAIISGIYWLSKYPHLYNYAKPVTNDNAKQMYKGGVRLLCVVNAITSLILFLAVAYTINAALHTNGQISKWILPIIIGLSAILFVYSIVGALKTGNNK
jgi:uncharacterized membrane protein